MIVVILKNSGMSTIELEARKAEIARLVLNEINSEEALEELACFIKRIIIKSPCSFTVKELDESANEAIIAYKTNDVAKFISHEQLKERYAR